jgi:hypothetical protein
MILKIYLPNILAKIMAFLLKQYCNCLQKFLRKTPFLPTRAGICSVVEQSLKIRKLKIYTITTTTPAFFQRRKHFCFQNVRKTSQRR